PPVNQAIALSDWTIARPPPGTRDSLVVTFPRPLDHGILVRALSVETRDRRPVDGEIRLEADDTAWAFTPVAPWHDGEYNLVAQSFLEDPEGNQIGRPFEAVASDPNNARAPGRAGADDAFRVAFTIGAP